jgi:hypothetical protein
VRRSTRPADDRSAWRAVVLVAAALLLLAHGTHAQVQLPNITFMSLHGAQRGATTSLTLVGTNLNEADAVLFDDSRITGHIVSIDDQGEPGPAQATGQAQARTQTSTPKPTRVSVAHKVELHVDVKVLSDVKIGTHAFRLRTPLGSTDLQKFAVGDVTEVAEQEPNDTSTEAQPLTLPVTVNGRLQEPGDIDHYRLNVKAGERLMLSIEAANLGSRMDSVLELTDETGTVIARNDDASWQTRDSRIIQTFTQSGSYVLKVYDSQGGGNQGRGNPFFYRLTIGTEPLVTRLSPLDAVGRPFNAVRVARGDYPEIDERDRLSGSGLGQHVKTPVTINGRIDRRKNSSSSDLFRFHARKGEKLVLEVAAERLGSPLDAVIEVLDARRRSIPRAVLQAVWSTNIELLDLGSVAGGFQVLSAAGLHAGDFILVDREVMQVRALPAGPGLGMELTNFRGRRYSYFGTSGVGHAVGSPVYRVEVHPPGAVLSPNGLPEIEVAYRNDDGGPVYGKDPYLEFIAPRDADYLVRIADTRGESGRAYAYRLTIAPPRPDFTVFVDQTNLNVAVGTRVPVTVRAYRHGGFDGPIQVQLAGLPAGLQASTGVILPGNNEASLTISSGSSADISSATSASFEVIAQATINGKTIIRRAALDGLVPVVTATRRPLDVRTVSVEPSVLELQPGERAKVRVAIARADGFKDRVNLRLLNLPFGLTVPDTGSTGIVVAEEQNERDFTIVADAACGPLAQTLYLATNDLASAPIQLHVTRPSAEPVRTGAVERDR